MSTLDNVEFFNRLTHFNDGLVELKVVENLIKNFQKYFIIKDMVCENENIKSVTLMEDDDSHLIFKIKFNKEEHKNKFIDLYESNDIEYKQSIYKVIIKDKTSHISLRLKRSE